MGAMFIYESSFPLQMLSLFIEKKYEIQSKF